jgi:hypothetical protein
MADSPTSKEPSREAAMGSRARPPRGSPARPLRPDDVREAAELRGPVIRSGVGALPAVWED